MSYCRWSSNNWQSDVYVYESERGWETHVAGRRVVGEVPRIDLMKMVEGGSAEMKAQFDAQHKFFETAKREEIGLAHDGDSFIDASPGACRARLLSLRGLGYRVPQQALDALDEEAKAAPAPDKP